MVCELLVEERVNSTAEPTSIQEQSSVAGNKSMKYLTVEQLEQRKSFIMPGTI